MITYSYMHTYIHTYIHTCRVHTSRAGVKEPPPGIPVWSGTDCAPPTMLTSGCSFCEMPSMNCSKRYHYSHTYIHTYIMYIHTSILAFMNSYISTQIYSTPKLARKSFKASIHTFTYYFHTYIHTYIHAYIHTLSPNLTFSGSPQDESRYYGAHQFADEAVLQQPPHLRRST